MYYQPAGPVGAMTPEMFAAEAPFTTMAGGPDIEMLKLPMQNMMGTPQTDFGLAEKMHTMGASPWGGGMNAASGALRNAMPGGGYYSGGGFSAPGPVRTPTPQDIARWTQQHESGISTREYDPARIAWETAQGWRQPSPGTPGRPGAYRPGGGGFITPGQPMGTPPGAPPPGGGMGMPANTMGAPWQQSQRFSWPGMGPQAPQPQAAPPMQLPNMGRFAQQSPMGMPQGRMAAPGWQPPMQSGVMGGRF